MVLRPPKAACPIFTLRYILSAGRLLGPRCVLLERGRGENPLWLFEWGSLSRRIPQQAVPPDECHGPLLILGIRLRCIRMLGIRPLLILGIRMLYSKCASMCMDAGNSICPRARRKSEIPLGEDLQTAGGVNRGLIYLLACSPHALGPIRAPH